MTFEVEFVKDAAKEWKRLNPTIRQQFARKLKERQVNPRVPSAALHNMKDCYKIKLRNIGYRLVYEVIDSRLVVSVLSIGKRERNQAYQLARRRMD